MGAGNNDWTEPAPLPVEPEAEPPATPTLPIPSRLVLLASPYAGEVDRNVAYARAAMRDALDRGEAPVVPHLLYTTVLDDADPRHRAAGTAAGLAWLRVGGVDALVVYVDLGISAGMDAEIAAALSNDVAVEPRSLPAWRGVFGGAR